MECSHIMKYILHNSLICYTWPNLYEHLIMTFVLKNKWFNLYSDKLKIWWCLDSILWNFNIEIKQLLLNT